MNRRAIAVGHDQRLVVAGLVGLVVGVDLVALVADVDAALRAVGVGARQRRADVFQTDAVFVEGLRDQIDAHGRQRAAADHDLADALDLRQLLRQHRGGGVVEIAARQRIRRQRQDQDRRVGRVDLAVGRIAAQAGRQVGPRRIDRGLHVARRAVDVAVQPELQRDAGRAHRARRRHLGDVGDLAEMSLERTCDRGRDILRAGAGQRRLHRDGREIHLRQRRHRQLEERDNAGRRKPERQQRRCHRPTDEGR
ncbi:hypothetical protein ACVIIY_004420 [Bradyrhizobium sp. USDA 4515]